MASLDQTVEERIRAAIARGDLDNLPGAGKPLKLDDDSMIPAELRLAFRVLKNSGHVPPEVETLRELGQLRAFLDRPGDESSRGAAWAKLQLLLNRLEAAGLTRTSQAVLADYHDALLRKLAEKPASIDRAGSSNPG